jgi:hypothetical protein
MFADLGNTGPVVLVDQTPGASLNLIKLKNNHKGKLEKEILLSRSVNIKMNQPYKFNRKFRGLLSKILIKDHNVQDQYS